MNKFRFKVINFLLASKFTGGYRLNKIEYPAILAHLDKTYGKPVYTEEFKNLDNWKIYDRSEWGSARPDNLCTFVKENVSIKTGNGTRSLVINTTPEEATGRGWNGETISRPLSSGMITSKFSVRPGQAISATVNTSESYAGSWFAFWLFKKDVQGDDRYREVDVFEKFMERQSHRQYRMSVHGGTGTCREMMAFEYPLFFADENRMTFTCELRPDKVKIFVNGIHLFLAEEPDFDGEYQVIFNDAPTTHEGKVSPEEIMRILPKRFEVLDFRVYSL